MTRVKGNTRPADIFVDIQSHIEAGRFIQAASTNKHDIRDFTFSGIDLSNCADILDLGCSYGFFTRGLAGRLHPDAHVLGIDLWPACEDYFVKACLESGFTGEFCLSDKVFCGQYAEKSFDLVLCSYALYFFPQAIQDIARVLRPNGLFITITHSVPHMQELVDIIKKLLKEHLGHPVQSLPLEKLFEFFSGDNGRQMLTPWFGEIREKEYINSLRIAEDLLPGLVDYLCFKKPIFIPGETGRDDRFVTSYVAGYLSELLARQKHLMISKDDTVFVCRHPGKT